jgi:O-antigen/teichoic acid export membrane protein
VLLTTALLGAQEAGLYFVATSAAALVRTWGTTIGVVALPRVAAATSKGEAVTLMSHFVRMTVIMSGAFAVLLILFARPLLVLVYGEAYGPAQTLVRILAVGMLAASLRYVLGDGLRGLGSHALATRAEVVGWLVGSTCVPPEA